MNRKECGQRLIHEGLSLPCNCSAPMVAFAKVEREDRTEWIGMGV